MKQSTIIMIMVLMSGTSTSSIMPNTQNESITSRMIEPSTSIYESPPTNTPKETQILTISTAHFAVSSSYIEPSFNLMTTSTSEGIVVDKSVSELVTTMTKFHSEITTTSSRGIVSPQTHSSLNSCMESQIKATPAMVRNTSAVLTLGIQNITQNLPKSKEIIAIVIRVPLATDVSNENFKANLTERIGEAYEESLQKTQRRRRETFGKINVRKMKNRLRVDSRIADKVVTDLLTRSALRRRRGTAVTFVKIVLLRRRSKTSEQIDVQFIVFADNVVVKANKVIEKMKKLTSDELAATLGYTVLRYPFIPGNEATPTQLTPPEKEKLSQRALLSAILIPVVVLVVLLPCLLMNTEGLSWKCLRRHNQVEPRDNAVHVNNIKNTTLAQENRKRKSSTKETSFSPPVPAASPISSKLLQAKEKGAQEKQNSKIRRPSIAQAMLHQAKALEEQEKSEKNIKHAKHGVTKSILHHAKELKENEKKEKERNPDKPVPKGDGIESTEVKKYEVAGKENRPQFRLSQSILLKAKEEKEKEMKEEKKVLGMNGRNQSDVSRSILRHAREMRESNEKREKETEEMGGKSNDGVNGGNGTKKKHVELDDTQQTCAAVVEMFSKFSDKQLVGTNPPRPPMLRAWTLSDITRLRKEVKTNQEDDDLISKALAERTRNKQLQKRKSDIPLEEIKKALNQNEKGISHVNNDRQPSLDFQRKRNKRLSRWKSQVDPINEQEQTLPLATEVSDVTPCVTHSSHDNVTQENSMKENVRENKNTGDADFSQDTMNSSRTVESQSDSQDVVHGTLMENWKSRSNETVTQPSVTPNLTTLNELTKNGTQMELSLKDNVLYHVGKDVTHKNVTEDTQENHSDTSHNDGSVTQSELIDSNNMSHKCVMQSDVTPSNVKSILLSKKQFDAETATDLVTLSKGESKNGDNVTQPYIKIQIENSEESTPGSVVTQSKPLGNALKRLTVRNEDDIAKEARHLVEQVLFSVYLEGY